MCKQIKPAAAFRPCRGRNGKPGLSSRCIVCNIEYMRAYYQNNKGKFTRDEAANAARNSMRRARYKEDDDYKAATLAKVSEYRKKHPERVRDQKLRGSYGISSGDYAAILESQGGGCAICGRTRNGDRHVPTLHVDHDHDTGKIRGILCSSCNRGVGLFLDDSDLLRKAAEYLDESTTKEIPSAAS